jgi:hypothetical protein
MGNIVIGGGNMIKLITETYNRDNEIVLRIEYDSDKELELIGLIRDYIDKVKENINDKDLEWDLAELKINICFEFTPERINEIKNILKKVKEKSKDNEEKVYNLENLILALIEMKDTWQNIKEKFREKFKVFVFRDILYIHL